MVLTVPMVVLNSRLESPKPNMYRPMPLMPCSALSVTLMNAMSRPMRTPMSAPANSPNQRFPVFRATKNAP